MMDTPFYIRLGEYAQKKGWKNFQSKVYEYGLCAVVFTCTTETERTAIFDDLNRFRNVVLKTGTSVNGSFLLTAADSGELEVYRQKQKAAKELQALWASEFERIEAYNMEKEAVCQI